MHQRVLDALDQLVCVHFKDIVHLADASRCQSFLVNMDVTVVRAAIGGIHVKVHYRKYR